MALHTIEFTTEKLLLLRDGIILLEPQHDDENEEELLNRRCDDLELRLSAAIEGETA